MSKKEKIIQCLEESGIIVKADGQIEVLDSVTFVSAILALEEEFEIEISEEYLLTDFMKSLEQVEVIIDTILSE